MRLPAVLVLDGLRVVAAELDEPDSPETDDPVGKNPVGREAKPEIPADPSAVPVEKGFVFDGPGNGEGLAP